MKIIDEIISVPGGGGSAMWGSITGVLADQLDLKQALDGKQNIGFKNRIINGGMDIDQRNEGSSVTPTDVITYTLDRWAYVADVMSKVSVQRVVDAPPGFLYSMKFTSLSAYGPLAPQYEFRFQQNIEGGNVVDFAWGTADAQTITVSFWIKSSILGTYYVSVGDKLYAYHYSAKFTIDAVDTWEQKTISIPGCVNSFWAYPNDIGLRLFFMLAAGSDLYDVVDEWSTTGLGRCGPDQTNFVSTNGATLQITGVQLEKGEEATDWDYRGVGMELELCQRYFQKTQRQGYPIGAFCGYGLKILIPCASDALNRLFIVGDRLQTPMRITPILSCYTEDAVLNSVNKYDYNSNKRVVSSFGSTVSNKSLGGWVNITAGVTAGSVYAAHFICDAEF